MGGHWVDWKARRKAGRPWGWLEGWMGGWKAGDVAGRPGVRQERWEGGWKPITGRGRRARRWLKGRPKGQKDCRTDSQKEPEWRLEAGTGRGREARGARRNVSE